MNELVIMFFGSGLFAKIFLENIIEKHKISIHAVVTQPDKPAGRDQKLTKVPVKEYLDSISYQGKVFQPESYREFEKEIIAEVKSDLIVVADYGQILPKFTINYPKYNCLNIHGSLLPEFRGAVPIPMSILQGHKKTGISIPVMTPGLDDGPIVSDREISIDSDDTSVSLKEKLAFLGAELFNEVYRKWINGEIKAVEQNHKMATYAPASAIAKEKAQIKTTMGIEEIDRMIRGFYPWPIVWTKLQLNERIRRLKIFRGEILSESESITDGLIIRRGKELILGSKGKKIKLLDLQLDGKKRGSAEDYLYLGDQKAKLID